MEENPFETPKVTRPTSAAPASVERQYEPCPGCGFGVAKKISFTWWGGALGPALFTHVRCGQCRRCFNGKTGKWNTVAITVYMSVGILLGIAAGLASVWHWF